MPRLEFSLAARYRMEYKENPEEGCYKQMAVP